MNTERRAVLRRDKEFQDAMSVAENLSAGEFPIASDTDLILAQPPKPMPKARAPRVRATFR